LEQPANVDIKIFTKDGLEIWDKSLSAMQGWNITQWDGTSNKYSRNAGSGAYFCLVIKHYPNGDKTVKSMIILVK